MIKDPRQRRYANSPKGRAKREAYEKANRALRAASRNRRRYGLSEADYARLLERAGCHICGRHTKFHIDHCHLTGVVRGLLCASCNRALGLMQDNPARLRAAAAYLEQER